LEWFKAIKDNVALVVWGLTLVTGATSFSVIGGIDAARELFSTPGNIKKLEVVLDSLELEIHKIKHYQEMDWEFGRLMTDNPDSLDWYYVDDGGSVHDVDIRHNAQLISLAFVHKDYMIYPMYFSPADNKYYLIVHDHVNGQNQNYYIYKRD
jgi:hypothetical protein